MTLPPLRPFVLPLCLLAMVLWCGRAVTAQDEPPARTPSCNRCGGDGVSECKRHRDVDLATERRVQACSHAIECRACEGALATDCKACTNTVAEAALAARRKELADWLQRRRQPWQEHLRKPERIAWLDTPHVELMFGLDRLTVGKRKLGQHELMHLYAERVEALRARFMEVLELTEKDFPQPAEDVDPMLYVNIFEEQEDHLVVGPRVTGIGTRGPSIKLMGSRMAWSMWRDPRLHRGDVDVHRTMVHNVSHLLLSGMEPVGWIGNKGHGWIDEGVAHWFEYYVVDETCCNFCHEEIAVQPGENYAGGEWRVALRKLAETGGLLRFADIYEKNSDGLDLVEHAHAFGWVDFLIHHHPSGGERFAAFLRRVKGGEATHLALRAEFGLGPLQFEERFGPWVQENYPLRK